MRKSIRPRLLFASLFICLPVIQLHVISMILIRYQFDDLFLAEYLKQMLIYQLFPFLALDLNNYEPSSAALQLLFIVIKYIIIKLKLFKFMWV